MKIKYLAHAAFLITSAKGTKIVTDPYTPSRGMSYGTITETADAVTVSHEHGDHNNVAAVRGNPKVVKASAEIKDVKIRAVPTAHDAQGGSQRGKNIFFCFAVDGLNIGHAGDLGHVLTADQVKAIGPLDILMLPVGGFFTIDAAEAGKVIDQLKPKVALPMHYSTAKSELPIAGIEDFLKGKSNVIRNKESEIGLKAGNLPSAAQIIVLPPAL